ncbi:MAG: thioredoxin family protein [Flavobacteriaceae bacterium]|nr:thioredoxin family protein [Flavobacteriaceae bacterium]
MKRIILLLTIVLFQNIFINAQEKSDLNWITDFEQAKVIAKQENKPILIFFTGSDWCGLCKMLEKDLFATKEFKETAKNNLILYKADFPQRRTDIVTPAQKIVNEALDKKYSKTRATRVFPTIVMVAANGKEINFIESYNYIHDTSRHTKLIDFVLQNY